MEIQIQISKYEQREHSLGIFQKISKHPLLSVVVLGDPLGDTALVDVGSRKQKIYSTTLKEIGIFYVDQAISGCKYVGGYGGCTWQHKALKSI